MTDAAEPKDAHGKVLWPLRKNGSAMSGSWMNVEHMKKERLRKEGLYSGPVKAAVWCRYCRCHFYVPKYSFLVEGVVRKFGIIDVKVHSYVHRACGNASCGASHVFV